MHVLRSGLKRLGREVGGQAHSGTSPVPPRKVVERPLHVEPLLLGHVDPRSRVECRLEWVEWAEESRCLLPGEPAGWSSMTEHEGRWAELRSIMKSGGPFQRHVFRPGPPSYVTTDVKLSFEFMVRAHGKSPFSSFLLWSSFSDGLGLPQGTYLDFPRLSAASVRSSWNSVSDHTISCSG